MEGTTAATKNKAHNRVVTGSGLYSAAIEHQAHPQRPV